jgi:hypothetical protein
MTNNLEGQVQKLLAGMDKHNGQEVETGIPGNEATDGIQDIYVLIVREHEEEEQAQIVDSVPVKNKPEYMAFLPACVFLLVIVSSLTFQLYCIVNPPIAIITIIPKSQPVTLTGTLQLGRVLQPLTISQSQNTATTGKEHQHAKAATGTVTFYNGQQTDQTIAQGSMITGSDGVSIETTQSATIPPGNPATGYGTATVTAQAVVAGSNGNIQAGDVNTTLALAVFVKNNQFTGGQDERTFQTVARSDIVNTALPLKTAVTQSMQGALQGQLRPQEQLFILPCTPTVLSDHGIGQEAIQVKVTVSQTCSAVAYSSQDLAKKATAFLSSQALHKTGAGYSLFGAVQVSVKQARVTSVTKPLVFVIFKASGTWIYGLSNIAQEQIKHLIVGKTTQQAGKLLASLTGIEQVSIRFTGFGDATKLPKQSSNIHMAFIVV